MKHIKNFSMFEAVNTDSFTLNDVEVKDVKKDGDADRKDRDADRMLNKLNKKHEMLVKKLKGLKSPGTYATMTKSAIRKIENEIRELKKNFGKIEK